VSLRWLSLALGLGALGLFVWFARTLDWGQALTLLLTLGLGGALAILGLQALAFLADVAAWQASLDRTRAGWRWHGRLWLVNAVGEAISVLAPLGSFGGEPVKAYLLKRHYGLGYREATASLLLQHCMVALAEAPFVLVGVLLLASVPALPPDARMAIVVAAVVLTAFMVLVIVLLRGRAVQRLVNWLGRRAWLARFGSALTAAGAVEQRIATFVRERPGAFLWSLLLNAAVWVAGAVELWLVLWLLGHTIGFGQAWAIETVVVLVRSVTFFVPAHLGAQDGALTLLGAAVTGSPETGLALALIRRLRELGWAALGLAVGAWFGLRPGRLAAAEQA
jgi:uncharacterized protein (TIRG00374 family)